MRTTIRGGMYAHRDLTDEENQIFIRGLAISEQQNLFAPRFGTDRMLTMNDEQSYEQQINEGFRAMGINHHNNPEPLRFDQFILSIVNYEGLEDLTWNGVFDIVSEGIRYPRIARVSVKEKDVFYETGAVLFNGVTKRLVT